MAVALRKRKKCGIVPFFHVARRTSHAPCLLATARNTNYLVIGTFASRDWANRNYGHKIEHAVELRESGSGISIISEEHWKRFV